VPERIFEKVPAIKDNSAMIIAYEWDYDCDLNLQDQDCFEGIEMSFGEKGSNPGDYIYVYEDRAEQEEAKLDSDEQVKLETAQAYDKVGASAHLTGNLEKAEAVMNHLGYTKEEF